MARLVGGVEETRYEADRGGLPFAPVDAARARAAVQFLVARGFATPARLLDPNVLRRIVPDGGSDPLQGSNLKLLQRLLDPGLLQRLAGATLLLPGATPYLGPDLLHDLDQGLFEELRRLPVEVGFYRRELQRNYVQLLVAYTRGMPTPQPVPAKDVDAWPLESRAQAGPSSSGLYSELAAAARDFRSTAERPSEFRAAARTAAEELSQRIKEASERTRDRVTAAHLAELLKALEQVCGLCVSAVPVP